MANYAILNFEDPDPNAGAVPNRFLGHQVGNAARMDYPIRCFAAVSCRSDGLALGPTQTVIRDLPRFPGGREV